MNRRLFLTASAAALAFAPAAGAQNPADRDWPALKPDAYEIATPKGVREEAFVTLGGVEQWVSIRGRDKANPVLLLIGSTGGGPGATHSLTQQVRLPWEEHFTVVSWDVRGSGKSYIRAGKEKARDGLTLDRIVADGLELTDHLRRRLGKRRIALLGIFYGATIGQKMALARPDAYSVLALDGPVANSSHEREQFYYDRLVELARAAGDNAALEDLKFSGPFVWDDGVDPQKRVKLSAVYRKYRPPNPRFNGTPPHWTLLEASRNREGMLLGDEVLLPEWKAYDFGKLGYRYGVPIVVVTGADNLFAPAPMARAWLDRVHAPSKAFHAIPGGGNHAQETHPEAYLELLVKHVRPLAASRER
ncbi:alpha/beta fold hydrolase [Phenylobacterium sp.]|jgi:pimeloyl-ACP methyl ester carboxylesterase|uniref:alpha/beta fold hydrolase n=1 Tax=Phenylobacterium sp. TaxID=1871053 RepID=UPI002F936F43